MRVLVLLFCFLVVCLAEDTEDEIDMCMGEFMEDSAVMTAAVDCTIAAIGGTIIYSGEDLSERALRRLDGDLHCPFLVLTRECMVDYFVKACGEDVREDAREGLNEGMVEEFPEFVNCPDDKDILDSISNELFSEGMVDTENETDTCVEEYMEDRALLRATVNCTIAAILVGETMIYGGEDQSERNLTHLDGDLDCPILILTRECMVDYFVQACGEDVREDAREAFNEGMEEEFPEFVNCSDDKNIFNNISRELFSESTKKLSLGSRLGKVNLQSSLVDTENETDTCVKDMEESGLLTAAVDCIITAIGGTMIYGGEDLIERALERIDGDLECPFLILTRECMVDYFVQACGEDVREDARKAFNEGLEEESVNCPEDKDIFESVSNELFSESTKRLSLGSRLGKVNLQSNTFDLKNFIRKKGVSFIPKKRRSIL